MFTVIGLSYLRQNNWDLVFGNTINFLISIIQIIACFIVYNFILNKLFIYLDKDKTKKIDDKENKLYKKIKEKPVLYSFIFIIICWLPYIVSFYPAILSPDPSFQIKQFFGIATKYADYSILIDPNVLITNHHPVIHTLLLGGMCKLGIMMGSINIGLFMYSIIQTLVLSLTLSYTIKFMISKKTKPLIVIASLLIYSLVPVFPFYAMSAVKDVIFGSLIIIYITFIYNLLKSEKKYVIKDYFKIIILIILMCLFRNNGIHIFILSFPLLIIFNKKLRKNLLLVFVISLGLYFSYSKIALPYFKITPGSIRETLSIPFQQTARYVEEHKEDLSTKDKQNIDNILNISTIARRYKPEIADPVKNEFNKYATREDLKKYFGTWFNGLIKHPTTYIEATINNTYGYFCPLKTNWYIYHKYDTRITEDGFDYHYNNLKSSRTILSSYGQAFPYIPVLGLIVNIAFNTWLIMIMAAYLIYIKKYKEISYLAPAIILILVCIASPVNAYFRYALPYIFGMPLMISIFFDIIKLRKEEKK